MVGVLVSQNIITSEDSILECNGKATIELILHVSNSIQSNPVDIMLILDESNSMEGKALTELKVAANHFIDIIDGATNNGIPTGAISGGSTIGIVRFNTTATFVNTPGMTNNTENLKSVINCLTASGFTSHGDALHKGRINFDYKSERKKIMILLTDGINNRSTHNADDEAQAAKNAGIEIYCIGLGDKIDKNNLNKWSTNSDMSHVIIAPTINDLNDVFEKLAANICISGATNIVIEDFIYEDFDIIGKPIITLSGNQVQTTDSKAIIGHDKKSIKWTISELGKNGNESASLKFTIQHVSCIGGNKLVNKDIRYSDNEGNTATFINKDNNIEVNCDVKYIEDINIDCCIQPEVINMDECEEFKEITLPVTEEVYHLLCDGRLLSIYVNLICICQNRKVAVGVIVYEVVDNDLVCRGYRAVEVTTPNSGTNPECICKTIKVGPFDFVLPEKMGLCNKREFKVKVIAHYSDSPPNNIFDLKDLYI